MIISLDIDGTISAAPEYFAELSKHAYASGGHVVINSSRMDTPEIRTTAEAELKGWGIGYEALYLFKPLDEVEHLCPHDHLDWRQKLLWQKVLHCLASGAEVHYDDDDDVLGLFKNFAPTIDVVDMKVLLSETLR